LDHLFTCPPRALRRCFIAGTGRFPVRYLVKEGRMKRALPFLGVAALASLILAASCPLPKTVKAPKSATITAASVTSHLIQISGDAAPFDYGGMENLEVNRGDTVRWSAPNLFEIDLGIDGPADRRIISGAAGDTGLAVIRLRAPAGEYKYSVTLRIGNMLVTDDPRLIVPPEDEGGD
jgi:hypothetical protein